VRIDALQQGLAAHFEERRAEHPGRLLYLLEHGRFGDSADALLSAVRDALADHSIDSGWWNARSLPLLVAATEVGYDYEGTGTDFWPIFERRFAVFDPFDRQILSRLFETAASRYGLAKPSETPWNLSFCHIAWPVLHAILPSELLQPLTRALREVRGRIDLEATDADLLAPIRSRAVLVNSYRLTAWLDNEVIAASIIRSFLNPSHPPSIGPSAMARITSDLDRDEVAATALRDARRRQKSHGALAAKRPPRRRGPDDIRLAPLVLRRFEQHWSFALKIPQMEEAERVAAREALDTIRWKTQLWGQGRAMPSRNLFSDYPIALGVEALPTSETPLLSDLASTPLTADARAFLESLRVSVSPLLLFADADASGDYAQLQTTTISANSKYILLTGSDHLPPPPSATLSGRIAGYHVIQIDGGASDVAPWLASLGFSVRTSAQFRWVGDVELEQHRPVRRFAAGSRLAFELSSTPGDCTASLMGPDGKASSITGPSPLLGFFMPETVGRYRIGYGDGEATEFDVAERAEPLPILSIDADAGTGSVTDLAMRSVVLRFDSIASVEEAALEIRIESSGREISRATAILPDTPCRLAPAHAIWDELLSERVVRDLLDARSATLTVIVYGLARADFRFEAVLAPFAWSRSESGELEAADESGPLKVYQGVAFEPLRIGALKDQPLSAANSNGGEDVRLFRAGHDLPHVGGGLCVGPKMWRPHDAAQPRTPERLLRRFDEERDKVDARTIIDALISWSAASVDHPLTQYRRGQVVHSLERWTVAQLCGDRWAAAEAQLLRQRGSRFAEAFLNACENLGIGFADVQLPRQQKDLLHRTLLRLMKDRGVALKPAVGGNPLDEEIAAALDEIFNDAYVIVADAIEAVGDTCPFDPDEDIDVGEASETWDTAVKAASRATAMGDLVELLRPLEAGDQLSLADFETMTADESIDLLDVWISKNRPQQHSRAWNRELVEAAFWLLAKPGVAARLAWPAAAQRLLADQFSARAIRYAALRFRGEEMTTQ
jgi:hypothetical protein